FSSALSSKAFLGLQFLTLAEESGFQPALRGLYQFPLYGTLKRIRQIGYTVASHQLSSLGKISAAREYLGTEGLGGDITARRRSSAYLSRASFFRNLDASSCVLTSE
ncbi:MAG TPA: hypothetical protein VNO32_27035, partial [Candidatus Acidoferrum sp.]|nr:hypothetical protein [Candidatus Acidoferrum sp.]